MPKVILWENYFKLFKINDSQNQNSFTDSNTDSNQNSFTDLEKSKPKK